MVLILVFFLMSRLAATLAVLLTVVSLVFGLIHLSGDPLAGLVPPGASPAQQDSIRRQFGLDQPLLSQYGLFLRRAAQGDFGDSWRARRPAMDAVLTRLPATLALTGAALGFALLLGVPLGIVAGVRPRGWIDFLVGLVVFGGQAMPGFWLGTVLIVVFAIKLDWLPASGLDGPGSLVLPAMALAAFPLAIVVRLLRTSLIETMRLDYVRTARAKGLNETSVVVGHALRNAALPALAYAGVQAGFLLGGAVVVEAVFAYPGMGRLVLQAVEDRDLPVVQAFVVLLALLIVAINLMVDVLARWLDPRMRFGAGAPSGGSA